MLSLDDGRGRHRGGEGLVLTERQEGKMTLRTLVGVVTLATTLKHKIITITAMKIFKYSKQNLDL